MTEFFARPGSMPEAVLVAEDPAHGVVGFAELSRRSHAESCTTSPVGFLEGWYVVPEHRCHGVGRALVAAAEAWARAQGCHELASDTELENTTSAAAHRALGFEEVAVLRCFRKALDTGAASRPMEIQLKRAAEPPAATDGARILVDRLWPRGRSKAALGLTTWLRDVAPSAELRRWFGHDPARWGEFKRRYFAELDARPAALQPLWANLAAGPVTLVYAAADLEHNNAVALREYLLAFGPRSA